MNKEITIYYNLPDLKTDYYMVCEHYFVNETGQKDGPYKHYNEKGIKHVKRS